MNSLKEKEMAKFRITWLVTGETEEVVQSDRDTVEGYIACRFGASYDESKAKVELVEEGASVAPQEEAPAPQEEAPAPQEEAPAPQEEAPVKKPSKKDKEQENGQTS